MHRTISQRCRCRRRVATIRRRLSVAIIRVRDTKPNWYRHRQRDAVRSARIQAMVGDTTNTLPHSMTRISTMISISLRRNIIFKIFKLMKTIYQCFMDSHF